MEIIYSWPPNIKEIRERFDLTGKSPIFCYGKFIFNPGRHPLDQPLVIHETVHSFQQDEIGPEAWWRQYMEDKEFRLDQETPAYQQQYKKFCEIIFDSNKRARYLMTIAQDMASPMYGNMIDYPAAMKLIRNGR